MSKKGGFIAVGAKGKAFKDKIERVVRNKDRAKAIIAQVAKRQIENKYGTVANAITEACGDKP